MRHLVPRSKQGNYMCNILGLMPREHENTRDHLGVPVVPVGPVRLRAMVAKDSAIHKHINNKFLELRIDQQKGKFRSLKSRHV